MPKANKSKSAQPRSTVLHTSRYFLVLEEKGNAFQKLVVPRTTRPYSLTAH